MADAQLQQFLEKVRQLNAFVARCEADPQLRAALRDCNTHHDVVALARSQGFEIGRRWGDGPTPAPAPAAPGPASGAGPEALAALAGATNLLAGPCPPPGEEHSQQLAAGPGWRLERIHSCLASSPPGFWYDQSEWEWVTLLQGSARLRFADEPVARDLCRGDSLLIRPHQRHRLEETDGAPGCVWLALFWQEAAAG